MLGDLLAVDGKVHARISASGLLLGALPCHLITNPENYCGGGRNITPRSHLSLSVLSFVRDFHMELKIGQRPTRGGV